MTTRRDLIAPSILASDFMRLGAECEAVVAAGADWLHLDVMDGHFVPNITFGLPIVEGLRRILPDTFLDVHLMTANPDAFIEPFIDAGANLVCFHPEASYHPHRTIQRIHAAGARAGLAINPGTSLHALEHLLDDLDMVLLMSVNPGFGGQKFIPNTLPKLRQLTQLIAAHGKTLDIQVDGGVTPKNIALVKEAGANVFVAGSAIFGSASYEETIAAMRAALA